MVQKHNASGELDELVGWDLKVGLDCDSDMTDNITPKGHCALADSAPTSPNNNNYI